MLCFVLGHRDLPRLERDSQRAVVVWIEWEGKPINFRNQCASFESV
jgi:hypothetical protein